MSVKINNIEFGNDTFPNNERIFNSIPWQACARGFVSIDFKYENDFDIWKLVMAKKYLDDKFGDMVIVLNMLYVPYSRMDREIEGYVFSLKYFCELINDLKFSQIKIFDAHSGVTEALLKRAIKIDVQNYINIVFDIEKPDFVFYPDVGAMKRYSEILKFPEEVKVFYGNKKRDLSTGKIQKFELIDCPEDIIDKKVLIVDDLCCKGGTFMASAKLLKEAGASNVSLYVSHCEDSIYDGEIIKSDLIDKVYTTDSLLTDNKSKKIVIISSNKKE